MERYKNLSGNSGIVAFETGDDWIRILFAQGEVFTYDADLPGPRKVAKMKALARAGKGLHTYINRKVRYRYSQRSAPIVEEPAVQ